MSLLHQQEFKEATPEDYTTCRNFLISKAKAELIADFSGQVSSARIGCIHAGILAAYKIDTKAIVIEVLEEILKELRSEQ